MTRRFYILVLVLLLAVIELGNRYLPDFQALSLKPVDKTSTSDFYLENMDSTVMLENGKPDYTLKAKRLTHFPDQDIAELDKVQFQLFRDAPSNWTASAEQGRIENHQGIIRLKGNVTFQRPASKTAKALKLSTSELHIFSKKDYAETSAPVKINSGRDQITATGMRLYLKEGRMEFLSSARVQYNVPH